MGRSLSIIMSTITINKAGPTGPGFYLLNSTINKAGPTGPGFYLLKSTINKAGPTGPGFYLLKSTINKAGPTGPGFVAPVQSCGQVPQRGTSENCYLTRDY
jgi:hypothetical protein